MRKKHKNYFLFKKKSNYAKKYQSKYFINVSSKRKLDEVKIEIISIILSKKTKSRGKIKFGKQSL